MSKHCGSCHGTRGEGSVGPALNDKNLLEQADNSILLAAIDAGRPGTTMPAWNQRHGGPLTDEDTRDVVAFVRAWEDNAPVVEAEVFEASAERGARLFENACFICHGVNGEGGSAPAINDPERLAGLDDEWYRATIASGRPAMGMPTWGTVLSPNQIEDLLELVRAWRGGIEVTPEITVAELLDSALFTLSQGDVADADFYLDRARPLAFGPALERFDVISGLMSANQMNDALEAMGELYREWPIGDSEAGKTVYAKSCQGCHGSTGQGGVGRRLAPNDYIADSSNSEFLSFLQEGRPGTAMRSFSMLLSEREMADVIAFVRDWQ